jgi:hypothetical protein
MQAGAPVAMPSRDVTPPFGTSLQTYREQTGRIAVPTPADDDITLTPAQQRGLGRALKAAWHWGRYVLLPGGGIGLWKGIEAIINAVRHAGH